MSLDDRIRRGLSTLAEQVEADAPATLPAARRRGRRKTITRAAIAVATAAFLTAGAFAIPSLLDRNPEDRGFAQPSGRATASPSSPAPIPETFVAATPTSVKVFSSSDRKEIRTLFESNEHRIRGVALSPDGRTVYFGRQRLPDGQVDQQVEIMSVDVDGGKPVHVADGHSPALSPDGRQLAYVGRGTEARTTDGETRCYSKEPIVVRDLASGSERRYEWKVSRESANDPYHVCGGPGALAWSPDAAKLAYERVVGDPIYEIRVLDLAASDDILDGDRVAGRSVRAPQYSSDGALLYVEDANVHEVNPSSRVHAEDGNEVLRTSAPIGSIAMDASREHLLVTELARCDEQPCLRVSMWTGEELVALVRILGGDYGFADW